MPRKKTEYERLKAFWYKKLKDSGFEDIEKNTNLANSGVPRSYHYSDAELRQLTMDYYCMAYHFLNTYEFDTELEKIMWDYHTNGLSVRDIVSTLKKAKILKTNKIVVWQSISKLEKIMKGLYLSA